jgi:hypothetical protein
MPGYRRTDCTACLLSELAQPVLAQAFDFTLCHNQDVKQHNKRHV